MLERNRAVAGESSTLHSAPDRAFNAFTMHPARALLYLFTAAMEPGEVHRQVDLNNKLNKAQGSYPGWRIDDQKYNLAGKLMKEDSGLWDSVSVSGLHHTPVKAFRVNPTDLEYRFSLASAILDWELQFPQLFARQCVGGSQSGSANPQPTRALAIYNTLLTSPNGTAAVPEFHAKSGYTRVDLSRTLDTLIANGTIEKSGRINFDERLVTLSQPSSKRYSIASMSDTVARLCRERRTSLSGAVFLAEIMTDNPDLDVQKVRRMLTSYPPPFVTIPKGVSYRIMPEVRPAIADLVFRVRRLRENANFVTAARKRALEIVRNQSDVAFLMAKARHQTLSKGTFEYQEDMETTTRRRIGSLTLRRLPIIETWRTKAACKDHDPDLFTEPIPGPSKRSNQAKSICQQCPVLGSCLQWSLDTGQPGIAGGMSRSERRRYGAKPTWY